MTSAKSATAAPARPRDLPICTSSSSAPWHRPRLATAPAQSGAPEGLSGADPRAGGSHRALPANVTEWRWSTGALDHRTRMTPHTTGAGAPAGLLGHGESGQLALAHQPLE